MDDILPFVVLAIVLVAIVTVIGHILWLVFAGILNSRTSDRRTNDTDFYKSAANRVAEQRARTEVPSFSKERSRFRLLLERLRERHRISEDTYREIVRAERDDAILIEMAARRSVVAVSPVVLPQPDVDGSSRAPLRFPTTVAAPSISAAAGQPISREPVEHREKFEEPAFADTTSTEPSLDLAGVAASTSDEPWSFAAFMEKSNIRWGELVGGMIIVFCSAALVITQWTWIQELPILKFFLFTSITAALFGVGLYTEHRWKLPLTSRGVLFVSTLLVPLNFVALVALQRGLAVDGVSMTAQVVAGIVFFFLTLAAAKVIATPFELPVTLTVIVASLGVLAAGHLIDADSPLVSILLWGYSPILAFLGAAGFAVSHASRWRFFGRIKANSIHALLATGGFATLVQIGLLVSQLGWNRETLETLSPLLALFAVVPAACGLLVRQRIGDRIQQIAIAATSLAILGAIGVVGAQFVAWPNPWTSIAVAVIAALSFSAMSAYSKIRAGSLVAAPFWALAYLLCIQLLLGRVDADVNPRFLVSALLSRSSGVLSLGLASVYGLLCWRCSAISWRSRYYGAIALAIIVFSFLVTNSRGFARAGDYSSLFVDSLLAGLVSIAAWKLRSIKWSDPLALLSFGLFGMAAVQFFGFAPRPLDLHAAPIFGILVVLSSIALGRHFSGEFRRSFEGVSRVTVWGGGALLWFALFATQPFEHADVSAVRFLWIAVLFLGTSGAGARAYSAGWAQVSATIAVVFAVAMSFADEADFVASRDLGTAPYVYWLALGCALLGFLTAALRYALGRTRPTRRMALNAFVVERVMGTGILLALSFAVVLGYLEQSQGVQAWPLPLWLAFLSSWFLVVVQHREQPKTWVLVLIAMTAAMPLLLIARRDYWPWRTADVVRWLLAGYAVLLTYCVTVRPAWPRRLFPRRNRSPSDGWTALTETAAGFATIPILLSWTAAIRHLSFERGEFMSSGAALLSHVLPLLVLAFSWRSLALRREAPAFAIASFFLCFLTADIAFVFSDFGSTALGAFALDCIRFQLLAAAAVTLLFRSSTRVGDLLSRSASWLSSWKQALPRLCFVSFWSLVSIEIIASSARRSFDSSILLCSALLVTVVCASARAARSKLSAVNLARVLVMLLAPVFVFLSRLESNPHRMVWFLTLTLGFGGLGIALLLLRWRAGDVWSAFLGKVTSFESLGGAGSRRLLLTPTVLAILSAAFVTVSASARVLDSGQTGALFVRLSSAILVLLQACAFFIFDRIHGRDSFRGASLALLPVGVLLSWWAFWEPADRGAYFCMGSALLVGASAFSTLSLFAAHKVEGDVWRLPAQRLITPLFHCSACVLLWLTGFELVETLSEGETRVGWLATSSGILSGFMVMTTLLRAAVNPKLDPLQRDDTQRRMYVYLAELLLAVVVIHVRLSMPYLFHGFFSRYWPFIIIVVAYAGLGLSEILKRKGQMVIAGPLERSAIFLPILPVLGFWAGAQYGSYSLLLVLTGLLYVALSLSRRSFGFGVLASVFSNSGLWFFLDEQEGWRFLNHPQVWLIPFALSVLLATYVHRRSLSAEFLGRVRYSCLSVIYVSSTAEIFLNGVASSPVLPLVLCVWSVIGVVTGIYVRMRSFLLLGSSFLLMSLISLVWHAAAARGWTWLWYVAGIAFGLAILVVFALFEKKRADMMRLVDTVKAWNV